MNERNELTMALLDVATTTIHGLVEGRGPSLWEQVKDDEEAYGPDFDYEVYDHGSVQVIYPVCNAALQWCYYSLPKTCPRWGAHGFVVETNYAGAVLQGMRRDGLISEDEYAEAMNANERDQHAGENQ